MFKDLFSLQGRVALVTGGSRGIVYANAGIAGSGWDH
jgi:NAD(P)-dependent dehydrogenase (short-subunit alcohol dehydrogenase family)